MKSKIFGSLAILPIMAAGVLAGSSAAQAVNLNGRLSIAGGVDITATDFDFLDLMNVEGPPDGEFLTIPVTNGDFISTPITFVGDSGIIQDIDGDGPGPTPIEDFLSSFSDPNVTFDLTDILTPTFTNIATGSTLSIGVLGVFEDALGRFDPTVFQGVFSADIVGLSAAQVDALLTSGGTLEDVSYSAQFQPVVVPESSTTAGLLAFGLVGGAFVARKRKQVSLTINS